VLIVAWFFLTQRARMSHTSRRIAYIIGGLGIAGIVLALPITRQLTGESSIIVLRSPARLLYWTEFSLAMALGAAVELILRSATRVNPARVIVAIALAAHAIDLGSCCRRFVLRADTGLQSGPASLRPLLSNLGDARVAIDASLALTFNRKIDDVGFFDSIVLARTYAAMLDICGASPNVNFENIDGSGMTDRMLRAAGVKYVITLQRLTTLPIVAAWEWISVFEVGQSDPRALFVARSAVHFTNRDEIHRVLREPNQSLVESLLIPIDFSAPHASATTISADEKTEAPSASATYDRVSSDTIDCSVTTHTPGFLRISESYDPGWSATIDGAATPVVPAWDVFLATAVPAGTHRVRFVYHTPGAAAGIVTSLVCLVMLSALAYAYRE
jgi:hypothetical protein